MPYKSCIVFSSPRAGTHLVMTGLHVAGMKETPPLTDEQWNATKHGYLLVEMPTEDHYRFGAHVSDPGLVEAYCASPLYGIYITRNPSTQARSYRAYLDRIRGHKISEAEALEAVNRFRCHNAVWASCPRVLPVRFEDLIYGKGWDVIFDHLSGPQVSWAAIKKHVPPGPGMLYYKNTRPSREYYGVA